MEDASLEAKTWQLTGETTATTRPENSLLEEHLMFDHIAKIRKFAKSDFSGVRVTRSLALCVCFVDRSLSFFFLAIV